VLRRSIDLVPGLLALAIREWWSDHRPDLAATGSGATPDAIGSGATPDAIGSGATPDAIGSVPPRLAIGPGATLDMGGSRASLDSIGATELAVGAPDFRPVGAAAGRQPVRRGDSAARCSGEEC
jgi:hypothetical protein